MTPDELERERAALLAQIAAGGPVTDDVEKRIREVARADIDRASRDKTLMGRIGPALRAQYAAMLDSAAIDDVGRGLEQSDDGTVWARSAARGRVAIGRLDYRALLAVAAEHDEARRRAPLKGKADRKDARKAEALKLHAEGWSNGYIARELRIHPRTVQRYLKDAEGATHREMRV